MQKENVKHLLKGYQDLCLPVSSGRLRQKGHKFEANFSCDSQLQDSLNFFF